MTKEKKIAELRNQINELCEKITPLRDSDPQHEMRHLKIVLFKTARQLYDLKNPVALDVR